MKALRWAAVVAALVFAATTAHAQLPDPKITEIRAEQLADNLHVLIGAGGNVAVLTGPDGLLLVDTEMVEMQPKLRAALARLSEAPPRFAIDTHFHTDHTGGNGTMSRMGATLIATAGTRRKYALMPAELAAAMTSDPNKRELMPVITFDDSLTLHLNGEEIVARHVPLAHTDTDAFVFFAKANVLHTGDLYMTSGYPYIDLRHGGTVDGLIAAQDAMLARCDSATRIIPGHGPVGTRMALAAHREMLATVRDRISRALAHGQSEDRVVKAQPTADFDTQYGKGFVTGETLVRWIYTDLSRRKAASRQGPSP